MLPRKNRLTNKKDFEMVYRYGSFFSFGEVSLKVKNTEVDYSRFGFPIGLKYSPKASLRNRAKRKLRGIIENNLEKIKKGVDIIVVLNKKAENKAKKSTMKKDFLRALEKGRLLIN